LLLLLLLLPLLFRGWELQRGTGSMEGQGTGNGLPGTAQIKESGDDGSAKPLPPCCVKARAAAPESEVKCHATVVSGWFTKPRSQCGASEQPVTFSILLLDDLDDTHYYHYPVCSCFI
jgi:hypothetical protein